MKDALVKEDYEVIMANNGAEAVDAADKTVFDLILIDIMMPTLSGYDLLRLLKEKFNGKMRMAFVTIVPKDEVSLDDIDGFIQIPFKIEEFVSQVKNILKQKLKGEEE